MAKVKVRGVKDTLRITIKDEYSRLLLSVRCFNMVHFHCAMYAIRQLSAGIKGDTTAISSGAQYAQESESEM